MDNRKTRQENKAIPLQNDGGKIEISKLIVARETRHRKKTRGVNHALMQQMESFSAEPLYIQDITEDFCQKFASFLLERVSVNSTRTYLNKLHALLEYAVLKHYLSRNPMPPIKNLLPRFISPQRTHLSHTELTALGNTPCVHNETKRAFLFACQTGLRLSDIESLRWNDILDIDGTPTIIKTQVKTGKEVRVPLNAIALHLIDTTEREGLVFKLMSRSVIASDLRQWAADAGIAKRLTFHVSRHTFATLSIAAGVDIYVVSKLCGHTTVKTTEIYAHMIDKTLLRGVNLLSKTLTEYKWENTKRRKNNVIQNVKRVVSHLLRLRLPKKILHYV